eukprot:CAMPEP_0194371542 /NCGR_PEP_ID=MMETSP0174-20130528/19962_1 /TAXON_ID=216777 /ORGANISM="Proboscia alata, Strain PI-D3" /LENGTH=482 /DNA_ID=CAMNT_0039149669 /DNA_START=112 /DNA_END=1560 /DNA_ORIENTATION=-
MAPYESRTNNNYMIQHPPTLAEIEEALDHHPTSPQNEGYDQKQDEFSDYHKVGAQYEQPLPQRPLHYDNDINYGGQQYAGDAMVQPSPRPKQSAAVRANDCSETNNDYDRPMHYDSSINHDGQQYADDAMGLTSLPPKQSLASRARDYSQANKNYDYTDEGIFSQSEYSNSPNDFSSPGYIQMPGGLNRPHKQPSLKMGVISSHPTVEPKEQRQQVLDNEECALDINDPEFLAAVQRDAANDVVIAVVFVSLVFFSFLFMAVVVASVMIVNSYGFVISMILILMVTIVFVTSFWIGRVLFSDRRMKKAKRHIVYWKEVAKVVVVEEIDAFRVEWGEHLMLTNGDGEKNETFDQNTYNQMNFEHMDSEPDFAPVDSTRNSGNTNRSSVRQEVPAASKKKKSVLFGFVRPFLSKKKSSNAGGALTKKKKGTFKRRMFGKKKNTSVTNIYENDDSIKIHTAPSPQMDTSYVPPHHIGDQQYDDFP